MLLICPKKDCLKKDIYMNYIFKNHLVCKISFDQVIIDKIK